VKKGRREKDMTVIKKCDVYMDLQFHLEAFQFMTILKFMWTKKLTMHLPSASPPTFFLSYHS